MENLNLPVRVTVSEAAKLFGVSGKTIRQALKNNDLRYVITRGRYRINFDSLLEWSQNSARRRTILSTSGIGRYVNQWKINNTKYSPNVKLFKESDLKE